MLEVGIKNLVMTDAGVLAITTTGGFLLTLPKDETLPSWTYQIISDVGPYALRGEHGFVTRRLQIDCYADPLNPGEVITLAKAIDKVLSGYQGTLPDGTIVFGCFRSDLVDFFDDAGRTYRRMLEYEIQFHEVS